MGRLTTAAAMAALVAMAAPAAARDIMVKDQAGYVAAVRAAKPGDSIVLADGVWRDFPILFTGTGTETQPITLRAQTPGKVVLSGNSSLRIAGKWLVIRGLVFRDGATPTDEVIAFRNGRNAWAEHVRLTEVVIDRYNQADRRKEDHWVALAGTDNRIDHSYFAGKMNAGATMVILRDKPLPLENRIQIDHNYFGPRPPLGSNGGETIRIGTSTESQSDSHTIVEDNLFEGCDGEVEIISVKSGANIVRRNTFRRSEGAVVLRHGNGNLVENNVFFGENAANTGGVRVINQRQTVRGNYMEGLAGANFRSAITVMNGVPNSPINRYVQVSDALIANNSVIGDRSVVTLAAGADAERSAPPIRTRLERNLLVTGSDPFRKEGEIDGISFSGNVTVVAPALAGVEARRQVVTTRRAANGLLYPTDPALAAVGAPRDLHVVTKAEAGPSWYPKAPLAPVAFGSGRTLPAVADGAGLARAVAAAGAGDTIPLRAGEYRVAEPLVVRHAVTLSGPRAGTARLLPAASLVRIENGGRLRLERLAVSGQGAGTAPLITTSERSMTTNYAVELQDCAVSDVRGDVLAPRAGSLADRIAIRDSRFANVGGAIVAGREEPSTDGWYTAEHVVLANVTADHVGTVIDLWRNGTDESTAGPQLTMTGSTVTDSGAVLLDGAQVVDISNNRFVRSAGVTVTHSVGYPHTRIAKNSFAATPAPVVKERFYKGAMRAELADNQVVGQVSR